MRRICRMGKRERAAGKKRFRGSVSFFDKKTAEWQTLKLGHKKMSIHFGKSFASDGGRCRKPLVNT